MNTKAQAYWKAYLKTLDNTLENTNVSASMAGNEDIADKLLALYLSGRKTAGSGLVKDYQLASDELPTLGDHWIILDSTQAPRCIVKTVRVEYHTFDKVPKEIAIAEGEGDLSLAYWRQGHIDFFTPFLKEWGINDLGQENVVTEFYEVVFQN